MLMGTGLVVLLAALSAAFGSPAAAAAMVPSAPAGRAALAVIPFPGTPDASPSSQVIFSALRPSELTGVTVSGTRSGVHAGRLTALPASAGTAFIPARQFISGERSR